MKAQLQKLQVNIHILANNPKIRDNSGPELKEEFPVPEKRLQ